MHEWWTAQTGGLIGALMGGGLGVLGGVYGGVVGGVLAPRGLCRSAVLTFHLLLGALGCAALCVGVYALIAGQPYHVWFPLTLVGFIGSVVMGSLYPVVRMRYRQAEERRLEAAGLRGV